MAPLATLLTLALLPTLLASPLTPTKRARTLCIVPSSGDGTTDDTPGFESLIKNCSSDATIQFVAGKNYNIFTPLKATGLSNVEIQIFGNLHLPQNISYIQNIVNGTSSYGTLVQGIWFSFGGSNLDITGSTNVTQGWIHSYGQAWWDANNSTGLPNRPHLMTYNVTGGTIRNLKLRKPIAWGVNLLGKDITVIDPFIDAFSNSTGFPFNTDGFDIQATNVLIEGATIRNGDDAIAIESGTSNVLVRKSTFIDGHGTSIGSLGQNQALYARVDNVTFDEITMVNSVYGARFKSWVGGQGLASNITWSNYKVDNVTFPAYVTQTYVNQGSAQTQNGNGLVNGRMNNASVIMDTFKWINWTGTTNSYSPGDRSCVSNPCWYDADVPTADGTQAVILLCANNSTCKNFEFQDFQVIPQKEVDPTVLCNNVQNSTTLGLLCVNGTFVQT